MSELVYALQRFRASISAEPPEEAGEAIRYRRVPMVGDPPGRPEPRMTRDRHCACPAERAA